MGIIRFYYRKKPFKHLKYDFKNKDLVFRHGCNSKSLVKDGVIEWHSDDFVYGVGSVLYIEKNGNDFLITFKKSAATFDRIEPFTSFTVSFSDNSRYSPYNITFMDMFNKLRDYDFYHNKININDCDVKVRKK